MNGLGRSRPSSPARPSPVGTVGFLFVGNDTRGMNRFPAFAAALLLCLAAIGGVAVSGAAGGAEQTDGGVDRSMTVRPVENSSGYLSPRPESIDRSESETAGIDVSGAIEAEAGELRSVYALETLQRQYENAETDAERTAVLEDGIERLSTRVDALEANERTAIREFNGGQRGADGLLRTLATTHREAEATDEALVWLEERADDVGADGVAERAATERVRLVPMSGPTRAELSGAIGGASSSRFHVETTGDGIAVATVDPASGRYLRAAHDPTAKRADVTDQYGGNPSPALDRFSELYPWAIRSFGAIDAIGPAQVRLYQLRAEHPHGQLGTFLDSGSRNVLYEQQRLDPGAMPTTTVTRRGEGLRLVVETTRAGGPLGVELLDPATGERVDGTVALDGETVGTTGADRLWTVAPRGPTEINATHEGGSVTLETRFD